jgi:hypothetical protein
VVEEPERDRVRAAGVEMVSAVGRVVEEKVVPEEQAMGLAEGGQEVVAALAPDQEAVVVDMGPVQAVAPEVGDLVETVPEGRALDRAVVAPGVAASVLEADLVEADLVEVDLVEVDLDLAQVAARVDLDSDLVAGGRVEQARQSEEARAAAQVLVWAEERASQGSG